MTPSPVAVTEAEKLAELGPEQVVPSLLAQVPCALKLPLNAVAIRSLLAAARICFGYCGKKPTPEVGKPEAPAQLPYGQKNSLRRANHAEATEVVAVKCDQALRRLTSAAPAKPKPPSNSVPGSGTRFPGSPVATIEAE